MPYFIRRYQSGVKNSGTTDILTSEVEISIPSFVMLAESTGPGKYLLCQRGPGIRGFKKITDCIIEDMPETVAPYEDSLLFSAEESVSVKRNLSLKEMNSEDLMDLMSSMESANINTDDEFKKFRKDLSSINREMRRRMAGTELSAENAFTGPTAASLPIASAAFGISPTQAGLLGVCLGGLGGVLGTAFYYRSKIDGLGSEMESVKKMLSEAEVAIKRAEDNSKKAVESASRTEKRNQNDVFDMNLLSGYQNRTRPQY